VRWGFARVSRRIDHGEETVDYLTANDTFGLEDIAASSRGDGVGRLTRSLRAIGYVDILRVPTRLIEEYVLPSLAESTAAPAPPPPAAVGGTHEPLIDFLVDNRIINGTAAMVIDTNRCVNCDDCVRACASAHDGNPRFVRHGPSHRNVMVANACMHCVDPVCLIGCPTGAIHRSPETGNVIIDDITCIGCATCAHSCPYHNIRMVETRNATGAFIVDDDMVPIVKATKCDLCAGQLGGPACARACPHDALVRVDIRDMTALTRWLEH
jgi:Fe-S-cluster-containing dehydrogenase component